MVLQHPILTRIWKSSFHRSADLVPNLADFHLGGTKGVGYLQYQSVKHDHVLKSCVNLSKLIPPCCFSWHFQFKPSFCHIPFLHLLAVKIKYSLKNLFVLLASMNIRRFWWITVAQLDGDDPQTVLVGIPGKAAVCDHPQVWDHLQIPLFINVVWFACIISINFCIFLGRGDPCESVWILTFHGCLDSTAQMAACSQVRRYRFDQDKWQLQDKMLEASMIGNRTLADQTNMFCRVGVFFLTRRWRYKVVGTWFCGECHLFQASWFLTERHWLPTAAHLWERGGWYSIYYDFFCTGTRTKPSCIGVLALEAKPMEKQLFWMRTFYGRLPYITCGMGFNITSAISYRCPWRKVALTFLFVDLLWLTV